MKIKICGNKYPENILEMVGVKPDYLGFIFYESSPRNITIERLPKIPKSIQKVGVFVDASLDFINKKTKQYGLEIIQLHGRETPEFCERLQKKGLEVWKVFSLKTAFDFSLLSPYEKVVNTFLFDTKGSLKGGNGEVFDWAILKDYPSKKPMILSGGIGLEAIPDIQKTQKTLPIMAVDINSRFEKKAGVKDPLKINLFKEYLE